MTQKFKGDADELKMEAAGQHAFDLTSDSLDEFFAGCYTANDWLLALYDNGRMPFTDRVPRDSFINFIKQAIPNFPVTGTFEAYIFILDAIFGEQTEVQFDVPSPGTLEMVVAAEASLDFDFLGREFLSGGFVEFTMQTKDGDDLKFTGISGIDSEPELNQLLSELIPAGILPDITLTFFELSEFIAEDGVGNIFSMLDSNDNQIVFFEP
jgi:hypothetical protein